MFSKKTLVPSFRHQTKSAVRQLTRHDIGFYMQQGSRLCEGPAIGLSYTETLPMRDRLRLSAAAGHLGQLAEGGKMHLNNTSVF